jgi:glyoxylase-like metal-dependent hydrolase (beta-lactamase superfamily II)/ferredoxin
MEAMARLDQRHPANVDGDWYVDARCIDCDACRQYAPAVFADTGGQSVVARQPGTPEDELAASMASVACPTQSIGTVSRRRPPADLFPHELEDGVFALGYNSEDSFGAHSYFARRPSPLGNVMVDSPRFTRRLADPIAEMGGIAHILLTHQDDVADAARYADRFGARVWIHEADRRAAPFATDIIEGTEPVNVQPGLVAVPVPGHTRGSVVYLLEDRFLFTGDSLAWSRDDGDLTAFRGACWYSWPEQTRSLARLADGPWRFEWVLAGHGDKRRRPAGEMHERLVALVRRMESS